MSKHISSEGQITDSFEVVVAEIAVIVGVIVEEGHKEDML
jgi:hypothetical protein